MHIPQEILDSIRLKARIEDVARRYVPSLKKRGKDYVGLCPFHQEKTPSFTVSPEKQIFYCFGCHAGGNVFSFISKAERLSFPESVRYLADLVGVDIPNERIDTGIREALCRVNRIAMEYYHQCLLSHPGKKGFEYLTGRGINKASIKDFRIGYAPDAWASLAARFSANKADFDAAVIAGLIRPSQKRDGSHYDLFRNRIIFPIYDTAGAVVGFGGRSIASDPRKYINSPESPVFKKRTVLYGFDRAKDAIRELDRAIVVEGYLDVIGCHQAGIPNVVAPLGTALTEEQFELLARHCNEIVLLFDADSAGLRAAVRSLEVSREINANIRIGSLPAGDPFEFVTSRGPRELMAVIDRAQSPADFRIARIMETLPALGRVNAMIQMFGVVRDLRLETERSIYLKKIASFLGVDEHSVRADYRAFMARGKPAITSPGRSELQPSEDFYTRCYRDLVRLVCRHPSLIEQVVIDFSIRDITDPLARNILQAFADLYYSDTEFSVDKIFDIFHAGPEMDFLLTAVNEQGAIGNPNAAYTEIFLSMKLKEIDDKIDAYVAAIESSPEYITEIEVLRREKEKLATYLYNRVT